jgi:hypothetical protein
MPRRGSSVGALAGDWRNGPLTFGYRWQRQRSKRWRNIAGAAKAAYVATRSDRGRRLRVQVVATNPDGSASAVSAPSPLVADGMAGHAQTFTSAQCFKGRARRPAAKCRGRRTSKRASARSRARSRRTSVAASAT